MAKLRIFVSSTCYDLGVIRSELRPFIDKESRAAIVDASLENRETRRHRAVFHVNKDFEEYIEKKYSQDKPDLDENS